MNKVFPSDKEREILVHNMIKYFKSPLGSEGRLINETLQGLVAVNCSSNWNARKVRTWFVNNHANYDENGNFIPRQQQHFNYNNNNNNNNNFIIMVNSNGQTTTSAS